MIKLHHAAFGAALSVFCLCAVPQAAAVDVPSYVKNDAFTEIKLSPNGDYYASTVTLEDRSALVIQRRSDNKLVASFNIGRNTHVARFHWVNPERVVISMAVKHGALDQPQMTGDLYAINANGSKPEILVGQNLASDLGSRIKAKKVEQIAAFVSDDLPGDDKVVVISVHPFVADGFSRAERMDVYSGRRVPVARAPVRNAVFVTDNQGAVRFASGSGVDNSRKLYYRTGNSAEWQLINSEAADGSAEKALGFSADDSTAYLQAEQPTGPDAIVAFDVASQTRKTVLVDERDDPFEIIYRNASNTPIGVRYMGGKPRNQFFNEAAPEARLYRSLEAAFGGDPVKITSQTADGALALIEVSSDRNPGDFYVFDTVAKTADHLVSRRTWFDPALMGEMRPISLEARDDFPLHGFLTLPHNSTGKALPMVVLPHGGPYGIQDVWGFDTEAQLLANAGYAVLQVNYRGSGGFGRAFVQAGAGEWGGKMQDDLTDATRWAMQEGIADPEKICIYGASYGGYAALMGVAKEPGLYRCAAGYVGVYDLPTMHTQGDIQLRGSGETYLREWIGEPDQLGSVSPNRLADRIKIPVFLAAGGKDERAPIAHTEMMEKALRQAGVPVETLYYPTEGHGFYVEANRVEYYTKLLAFLSKHIGGATASTGSAPAK
ncbi:MAG: S9 family peptidase [Pseudomonadota bacterium]|nr:S9 family peptidase [Pseudomonadota bacterium]